MSSRIRLFGIFYKHCVYCINYYMKFNVFIFYSTQNAFGSNEADAYIRIIQLLSRAQIASLTFNSKKINYQSFFKPSDSDRKNSKKKGEIISRDFFSNSYFGLFPFFQVFAQFSPHVIFLSRFAQGIRMQIRIFIKKHKLSGQKRHLCVDLD